MIAMLTEMYLHVRGENNAHALEELIDRNLTGISAAEDRAENKHFIQNNEAGRLPGNF